MIITLIFLTAALSLLHYLNLEGFLAFGIGLPLPVYLGVLGTLILLRVGRALYKWYPIVRRFCVRLSNLVERETAAQGSKGPVKGNSPFGNKPSARNFSTSAVLGTRTNITSSKGKGDPAKNSGHPSLFRTTLLRLNFKLEQIQEWFTVKGGRPLVNILKGISIMAGATITSGYIRYICHFIRVCNNLKKTQGIRGLTLFLKASGVSLQQSLGGHLVWDAGLLSGARFSRNKAGLPRWIPPLIRQRLKAGDPTTIRVTLTLINVFRIFTFPGELKLKTITDSFSGTNALKKPIESFIILFVNLFVWDKVHPSNLITKMNDWARESVFPIFKGGPGVRGVFGEWNTKPDIMIRALMALERNPILWEAFTLILGNLDYVKIKFAIKIVDQIKNLALDASVYITSTGQPLLKPLPYLGKLGTKVEAAGKIRVFAMVDAWTQWVLYPLHKAIFWFISNHKMDGTFNQTAPLSSIKPVKGLWSLDLSAATDRLPLDLQRLLIAQIFGHEFAGGWSNLLVGRTYRLHDDKSGFKDLKYEVGQPMGALSSWASLALTHHFIIQVAAWRAGFPKWKLYTNYAVLGDDVVIGDARVMRQYLLILESLGVKCGLHKSLLSHKGIALEFAKRTIVNGHDVSPVAFKEFYAASRALGAWIELRTKFGVPFHKALQAFGVGWKNRSWLNKPIGKLSARLRLIILACNIPKTREEVEPFFKMGQAPVAQYRVETMSIMESFVRLEVKRLISKVLSNANKVNEFDSVSWGKDWARDILASNIQMERTTMLDLVKAKVIPKAGLLHARKLLADAFTNIANLTWHSDKIAIINEAARLIDDLNAIDKGDFPSLYMEYLRINEEIAGRGFHTFARVRPQIAEVPGLLKPHQVRLWKRWSQVLQGTQKVPPAPNPFDKFFTTRVWHFPG